MIPNHPNWNVIEGEPSPLGVLGSSPPPPLTEVEIQINKGGPEILLDSRGDILEKWWVLYHQGTSFHIRPDNGSVWGSAIELFEEVDTPTHLDFTFDQLGRPITIYIVNGILKLNWYDPLLESQVTTEMGLATSCAAGFDLVNDTSNGSSDAMLAYVRDGVLYWKLQRDRWEIEYNPGVEESSLKVLDMGMNTNNQFQIRYETFQGNGCLIPPPSYGFSVVENGYQKADDDEQDTIIIQTPPQQNDGDLLIAAVMFRGDTPPLTPPDWTLQGQYHNLAPGTSSEQHLAIYYKDGGDEGTSEGVVFEGTEPNPMACQIYGVAGSDYIVNVIGREVDGGGTGLDGGININTFSTRSILVAHWLHGSGTNSITGEDVILGHTNSYPPLIKLIGAYSNTPTEYTIYTADSGISTNNPAFGLLVLEMN